MNLHSSQTDEFIINHFNCLRPLWIYTALKPLCQTSAKTLVWDPYEFTQLSNAQAADRGMEQVWDPYEFTQLSNNPPSLHLTISVWDPYEFTQLSNNGGEENDGSGSLRPLWIYTALKLPTNPLSKAICLRPLWIYTALKLCVDW